jgi:hypothetical protein
MASRPKFYGTAVVRKLKRRMNMKDEIFGFGEPTEKMQLELTRAISYIEDALVLLKNPAEDKRVAEYIRAEEGVRALAIRSLKQAMCQLNDHYHVPEDPQVPEFVARYSDLLAIARALIPQIGQHHWEMQIMGDRHVQRRLTYRRSHLEHVMEFMTPKDSAEMEEQLEQEIKKSDESVKEIEAQERREHPENFMDEWISES